MNHDSGNEHNNNIDIQRQDIYAKLSNSEPILSSKDKNK